MKHIHNRYVLSYTYNKYGLNVSREYIESRLKFIRPYIKRNMKILELGCGDGLLGEVIKRKFDCELYGIDTSSSGVSLAKRRGIIAKIADLNEDLPYEDNTFDMIFSDQLLEHVYRTDHLLDEMHRILKPGGVVITITPNLSFWVNRILFPFGFYPMFLEASEKTKIYGLKSLKRFITDSKSMGHIRVFNKAALLDIFQNHNYFIAAIKGSSLSWILPSLLKHLYDHMDRFFALFPPLSRDIVVIAFKPKTNKK